MSDRRIKYSFLMPCRFRLKETKEAIESVFKTCSDPSVVEFIVRLDNDDVDSITQIDQLQEKYKNIKKLVGDRGMGYGDLHKYYNECFYESEGDYLYIWGNDNVMETKEWDKVLDNVISQSPAPLVIWPHKKTNTLYYTFPCLNLDWFDIVGLFPDDYPFIDTFIWETINRVAKKYDWVEKTSGIKVSHKQLRDQLFVHPRKRPFKHLNTNELNTLCDDKAKIIIEEIEKKIGQ